MSEFSSKKGSVMLQRIIIFFIRIKLGLKKGELFQFANQKSGTDEYYFDGFRLMKIVHKDNNVDIHESNVSLNWLLNDNCKIHKTNGYGKSCR